MRNSIVLSPQNTAKPSGFSKATAMALPCCVHFSFSVPLFECTVSSLLMTRRVISSGGPTEKKTRGAPFFNPYSMCVCRLKEDISKRAKYYVMHHLLTGIASLICAALFIPTHAFGQQKFEKEYRINAVEAPAAAQAFISKCAFDGKVKWYREESQDGKTIEAKTKHRQERYSIEFDSAGALLDVEKTVRFKRLNPQTRKQLCTSLDRRFLKYKISKTQIQWTAPANDALTELIKTGTSAKTYTRHYELVLKAKSDGTWAVYELLLEENGAVVQELKVVQRHTDNLEF